MTSAQRKKVEKALAKAQAIIAKNPNPGTAGSASHWSWQLALKILQEAQATLTPKGEA